MVCVSSHYQNFGVYLIWARLNCYSIKAEIKVYAQAIKSIYKVYSLKDIINKNCVQTEI